MVVSGLPNITPTFSRSWLINVQVILEALGGGGNSTTAGGQARGITVAEAKAKLLAAIDKYFED